MIDILWTLIILWLVFRVASVFTTSKKTVQHTERMDTQQNTPDDRLKKALNKKLDREGEYVDYEEVK
jgi:hypothetical protein